MGLMDILQQYSNQRAVNNPQVVAEHFDEVVRSASPDEIGSGVAEALRSDQTPPFEQMVAQMFDASDPHQRAGVLNQILSSIGPGVLAGLGGGLLGKMFGPSNGSATQITPAQASQVTPAQVEDIAKQAEKHDPGVIDKIGEFYSAHPDLVKTLGSAALAIALASIAGRVRTQH